MGIIIIIIKELIYVA